MNEKIQTKTNKETVKRPCFIEDFLTENDKATMPRILVPKPHLFGAQPKEAYSTRSRKEAFAHFGQEEGRGYLTYLQHPTLVVPLFYGNSAYLTITDGHHRARYVDRSIVPCRIATLEEATSIYNRFVSKEISPELFREDLQSSVFLALKSFEAMPIERQPRPVLNVGNIKDLVDKFDQF